MATIQLPHNGWIERPYQRNLWSYLQSGGKRAIEIAHRRWGKDDVCLHHTAIAAHERVASYWHCLPLYSQARKAVWTAVNPHTGKRRIDEAFPTELRASTNDQEMFIRFKNGSTWQVIGSDRYNTLVGAGVAGVTFSEWALANPSSWGYIRPMLEENNGWAVFITTPRGRNHAHRMFERAKNNENWFAEISSIHHTGALSAEQLAETLDEYEDLYGKDLGQAQYDQEYGCSFNAAIMGAFYAREMSAVRVSNRIVPIVAIPNRPVHRAWDIGVRDDTSIWWFQVVGGRIYILDCYTNSGAGVEHYAEEVAKRRDEHGWIDGNDYVPHDAKVMEWGSGRTRLETMQILGLSPVLVPLAGKLDGINAVRKTIPLCLFHPRTEEVGVGALEQYRREWDDEKKCFKANEVHDWTSHLADAFRYLAMSWRLVPVHIDVSIPQPKAGQTMLPPPPGYGEGGGKRIRL